QAGLACFETRLTALLSMTEVLMALRTDVILRSPQSGRLEGRISANPAATAETGSAAALGPLPEWDLADLYSGRDSPELTADLATLAADATAFGERYQGKLADLAGAQLGAGVAEYERLQEVSGRIMSYAEL